MHVNPTYLMKVLRTQQQISIKIKEIKKNIDNLYQNSDSDISIKYRFLQKKIHELYSFTPPLYNVWNTSKINNG